MDKRRFFSKFYFVLLTCLLILPCSKDVNSEYWQLYFKGSDSLLYYYDADGINVLPNNIIRMWIKSTPESEEGRAKEVMYLRIVEPTTPYYYSYSTILYEINCKDRTFKALYVATYNTEHKKLSSTSMTNPSLARILPESMMDELSKIVCVKKDLKKEKR
jgi:hypothetical protein